ncbi:MAG: PASTA domain-containing protein [Acidobacteriota bacterium]
MTMWRRLLRGFGCLGYLTVLGTLFGIVSYIAFSLFVRGGVTATPDLYGMEETDAASLLADQGLDVDWADEPRYDENVPKGHVMDQDPSPGVYVKREKAVVLTLSRGPRRIAVPALAGQAVQAAQVSLAAAGLTLGRTYDVYAESGLLGVVVDQAPAPGELVEVDAPVDLFLSIDATGEVYIMPDLVKRSYDSVRGFFEARGFRIGRVGYQTYDGVEPGTVLRQFPVAGHPLRRGDVISLDVVAPLATDEAESPEPTVDDRRTAGATEATP